MRLQEDSAPLPKKIWCFGSLISLFSGHFFLKLQKYVIFGGHKGAPSISQENMYLGEPYIHNFSPFSVKGQKYVYDLGGCKAPLPEKNLYLVS